MYLGPSFIGESRDVRGDSFDASMLRIIFDLQLHARARFRIFLTISLPLML